ncbi:MAG: hypothetical protein DRR19_24960, partial [Candidatus Parabeggiatoa sp. nov. 1]
DNGDYALLAVLAIKDGVVTPETPSTTSPKDSESKDNATPEPRQQAKLQQQQALGESEFNQLVSGLKTSADIEDYSKKLLEDS